MNSTSQPETIEQYNGAQMLPECLCVLWKWIHSWDSGRLGTGPFGDDPISRTQKRLLQDSQGCSGNSSVQFSLVTHHVRLFATPWNAAQQAFLSITNSWSLLKLMSIKSVMPSNHLILCCPLLLLPSILLSIRIFADESVLGIRWPNYWSFSFSIVPSNEYSGLLSFRIDWFDLLAVQGTLKSLLQYHSSKASILQCSAFFMVQLYGPTLW